MHSLINCAKLQCAMCIKATFPSVTAPTSVTLPQMSCVSNVRGINLHFYPEWDRQWDSIIKTQLVLSGFMVMCLLLTRFTYRKPVNFPHLYIPNGKNKIMEKVAKVSPLLLVFFTWNHFAENEVGFNLQIKDWLHDIQDLLSVWFELKCI